MIEIPSDPILIYYIFFTSPINTDDTIKKYNLFFPKLSPLLNEVYENSVLSGYRTRNGSSISPSAIQLLRNLELQYLYSDSYHYPSYLPTIPHTCYLALYYSHPLVSPECSRCHISFLFFHKIVHHYCLAHKHIQHPAVFPYPVF